jgi:hypothetical protein
MKHFLLSVFTDGGEHHNAPSYFMISLSQKQIDYYLELRGIALELRKRLRREDDSSCSTFHNLAVWDFQPTFFDRPDVDEEYQEKLDELLGRAEDECLELTGDEALFLDTIMDAKEGRDEGGYQRMDYVYAKIDEDDIYWTGCVKHCDYNVSTAQLSWSALGVTREPEELSASERFTVEAGRQIYRDGQPFISIRREGDGPQRGPAGTDNEPGATPTEADELTHIIAVLLNRLGNRSIVTTYLKEEHVSTLRSKPC